MPYELVEADTFDYEIEYESYILSREEARAFINELPGTEDNVFVTDIEYNDDSNYFRIMIMFDDMTSSQFTLMHDNIEHTYGSKLTTVFLQQHNYTSGLTEADKEEINSAFHGSDIRETF